MSNENNSDCESTENKDDNLGGDESIPNSDDGIAVGHSSSSSFEPEEDEHSEQ